jgi:hypothetical protein
MKYVPHPEYVQYCNDIALMNMFWMLAFMAVVVIPYFLR